jgi:hypothetical protein
MTHRGQSADQAVVTDKVNMMNIPNRANSLLDGRAQDEQEPVESEPIAASSPSWHRPVVTIIPLKMTLLSSGQSGDGSARSSFCC